MITTDLKIIGMSCAACVGHVRNALEVIPGVRYVFVDLQAGLATVQHDGDKQVDLIEAVAAAGCQAHVKR